VNVVRAIVRLTLKPVWKATKPGHRSQAGFDWKTVRLPASLSRQPQLSTLLLAFGMGLCATGPRAQAAGPDSASIPPIIQAGFALWAKGGGVDVILDSWQRGGAMEGNNKANVQADYFKRVSRSVGNYKSFEFLKSDTIGRSAEIIYLAINFERGAVYSRFVVYHTEKDWVVQNMDFSTKPESIMPWLAFAGDRATE